MTYIVSGGALNSTHSLTHSEGGEERAALIHAPLSSPSLSPRVGVMVRVKVEVG